MNRLIRALFAVVFVLTLSCSGDGSSTADMTMEEALQDALDDAIDTYGGKGVSLAVILPDGRTWSASSGLSKAGTPIRTDMLFSIGSATKTFTAAVILQLAEEGTLTLDDTLSQWLPDYDHIDNTITIRQLLNHTSGIYNFTEHPTVWDDIFADLDRQWTMEEIVEQYVLAPYFDKGSGWHYTNTGYLLLRMIIQEATGSSVSSQYRERLFTPTGLTDMFTAVEEPASGSVANAWYDLDDDGDHEDLTDVPQPAFYSAIGGGIYATAEDFAKWVKAVWHDQTVINQSSFDQMMDFHTPTPGEDLIIGYGLGAAHYNPDRFNGLTMYGHTGNPIGYTAGGFYLTAYGVAIAILDNTDGGDTMPVINDVLRIIVRYVGPR